MCDDGTYGHDCKNNCSGHCMNGSQCNKLTGHCDRGCNPGYTGSDCSRGMWNYVILCVMFNDWSVLLYLQV